MKKGLVIKSTGSNYRVNVEGNIVDCSLAGKYRLEGKKSTNPVAVGDWVKVSDDFVIEEVEDRKNYIVRRSVNLSKRTHIIASNLDLVVIVASISKPGTSTGFINRVLITAEAYHIPAAVIFNKSDLLDEDEKAETADFMDEYDFLGYRSFSVSALQKTGLEPLKDLLKGKTSLFIGHSGAGKSSLINALDPNFEIKTGIISRKHQKGTHTTTFAEMHDLSFGAKVIDTPGIKEFGTVGMEKTEISDYFPELRELRKECKFPDCLHINEPGCAVLKGLEIGAVAEFRYNDYVNILNSNEFVHWEK